MIAASAGRDSIVSMLIGHGASVNSSNEGGQTPLHYAASRNRYEVNINTFYIEQLTVNYSVMMHGVCSALSCVQSKVNSQRGKA